jgi:hypothetical protein
MGGSATLLDTKFTDNRAKRDAGAILVEAMSSVAGAYTRPLFSST